jgi:hypothetical protein
MSLDSTATEASMIIRPVLISALAVLCCAAPVLAAEDPPAPTSETADSDAQVVCQVQRVTGSRLDRKRVCLTRAQWREQERQLKLELNSAQRIRPGSQG